MMRNYLFPKSEGLIKIVLLQIMLLTTISCTNGQSYNNIYTEENWNDRDKWQKPELIIEQLQLPTGGNVADIGCHEGYMTIKLANHLEKNGKVYAVDLRSSRLERLREHLKDRGLENVEVIEGEADDPKLPQNSLDAVLIMDTYHEMDQHQSILGHVRSALKENGRLVILEPIRDSLRGRSRSEQEGKHEIDLKYVKQDLENAGFRIIKEEDPYIDRVKPKGDNLWLIIAVKDN